MMRLVTPGFEEFAKFLKTVETKWKVKLERRFEREQFVIKKEESSIKTSGVGSKPILPRYILSMFPYPSGKLHLGHVRIYTSGDLLARFSRMLSKHEEYSKEFNGVITPMGFDSFGLPAENAAKERGLNPSNWTNSNIRVMKKQLDDLALQFDWREATSNPSYYKWTQDLFLKLFDAGLVYKSFAKVNWDPVDQTVLADEQVDESGRSWRSGALVESRYSRQWFVKVNSFVDAIYEAKEVELKSWRDVLSIQRNWVGKPAGWLFYIPISHGTDPDIVPIFTERPELFLCNTTKLVLSRDHWLETVRNITCSGHITNPFTNRAMRVVLSDGSIELPSNCNATLISDDQFGEANDGFNSIERQQVLLRAKLNGLGGYRTSNKYRDWLVSRQRFWGTPIPIVRCDYCGYKGVSKDSLPVTLPRIDNLKVTEDGNQHTMEKFRIPTPIDKLAPKNWLETSCPSCESSQVIAHRESETLDTLFDSSWYFLRYASSPTSDKPFNFNQVQPVWCYIGGLEHASMHLFYARFVTHFLQSLGLINFKEPFRKLMVQGVVKSKTYKLEGRYIPHQELESIQDKSALEVNYEKMSKSKGNGVDPEVLLEDYGIDATRFCLMSYANPRSERLWRSKEEEFKEVLIYLRRVVLTVQEYCDIGHSMRDKVEIKLKELSQDELEARKMLLRKTRNKCTEKAINYIQEAHLFRQFISELHVILNSLRSSDPKSSVVYTKEYADVLATLILMLNPITPHLSEELWLHFSNCIINPLRSQQSSTSFNTSLQASDQPWPLPDKIK